MTDPLLQIRGVGWCTGSVTVLADVSFEVHPGEFIAILGRNGAGKSTLLDIVAGLKTPSAGEVRLDARALHAREPDARARLVAHLPQTIRGDLALRAEALVLMGRYTHATGWFESGEDRAIAAESMRRCQCDRFRDRIVATLSGGERQRVLLAACLAQQPRVLLLDEPATFLDLDQQLQCFTVLQDEARRGTACLAVTHDVNLAVSFCSRLIGLDGGSVVFDVPAAGALDTPTWLQTLSRRLEVHADASGRRWVGYQ